MQLHNASARHVSTQSTPVTATSTFRNYELWWKLANKKSNLPNCFMRGQSTEFVLLLTCPPSRVSPAPSFRQNMSRFFRNVSRMDAAFGGNASAYVHTDALHALDIHFLAYICKCSLALRTHDPFRISNQRSAIDFPKLTLWSNNPTWSRARGRTNINN